MKNIASILFTIALVTAFYTGSKELAIVSFAGLFFSNLSYKSVIAAVQIYPVKFSQPNGDGIMEEVPFVTRAERELYQQLITLNRANPVTLMAIQQGGLSFDPISYYIRFNITGLSGSTQILGPATARLVGTTNFPNGATLSQYYNFCFDRIIVKTALTNTANTAVGAVSGWTNVSASVDPAVRNGELRIRSNRNLIVESPITDYLSDAAVTGGGTRDYSGGSLEKPRFFLELLQSEVEIGYATGATVANTANTTTWLEVQFCGIQARLKM